jgi:hypothetical protein
MSCFRELEQCKRNFEKELEEFKSLASQLEGCGQVCAPWFCLLQLQPIKLLLNVLRAIAAFNVVASWWVVV